MIGSGQSYLHVGGDQALLGATIYNHFDGVCNDHPDNPAIISVPQDRRLSYQELRTEVDRVARGLMGIGFGAGDRIGIWSTNNIEWLVLQIATARIGSILVNINPAYRLSELRYALKTSEVQAVVTIPAFRSSNYLGMLRELVPELDGQDPCLRNAELPLLRRVIVYDPKQPENSIVPTRAFTAWQELLQVGEGITGEALIQECASLDADDPINIQYTSGTTGFPKAVVLTHHNILNNAYFAARIMNFTEDDRLCVPVPFYHCFGMVLSNLLCLTVGACIVIPSEHFDPLATLETISQERCTGIHGVPTMFVTELEHPRFGEFDLRSLRTGIMAGAPCPPELMRQVIEDMYCNKILIGYGQTEASPLTHLTRPDDTFERRIETVGRNLPHQEVKVVDVETGKLVRYGETGEICFRGYHVMRGYYGNEGATAGALDTSGWLHSGDLGEMDESGYLRITGRLKDMIIRGGENIYPAEIEAYLFEHPKIAQIAVFGVPDKRLGEEVAAWVQLHAGQSMSADELKEYCRDEIAHFKIPVIVRFVDEFPMTVTGKIKKFELRDQMISEKNAA